MFTDLQHTSVYSGNTLLGDKQLNYMVQGDRSSARVYAESVAQMILLIISKQDADSANTLVTGDMTLVGGV